MISGRSITGMLTVALFYYLGAHLSALLGLETVPVSAILLAALILSPPAHWGAYIAIVFPAHLAALYAQGMPVGFMLSVFACNVAEALIGGLAIRRYLSGPPNFARFRDVYVFITYCVALAPILCAFPYAAAASLAQWHSSSYWAIWIDRMLGDALTTLLWVPPAIIVVRRGKQVIAGLSAKNAAEVAIIIAGAFITSFGVFLYGYAKDSYALLYAPVPFLLWAAVRKGAGTVSVCLAAMALCAMIGLAQGKGPFGFDPHPSVLSVQIFLVVAAIVLMLLAASSLELRQTQEAALEQERQLKCALAETRSQEHQTRSQQEQLTHLSRAAILGELSGAIAHELNQPLAAIMSNAQAALLQLHDGPRGASEFREVLEDIVAEDRRASEVIRRLRALFVRGTIQMQVIDANECVREVLKLQHSDLIRRNVIVEPRLAPDAPAVVADRVQLQQVLLNLIVNACDAMSGVPAEERHLCISTTRRTDLGLDIEISDRGHGIQELDKIFEPFYSTKDHGLGLGLSICRTIIATHQGRLWATNNLDCGATLHISFPPVAAHTTSSTGTGRTSADQSSSSFNINIPGATNRSKNFQPQHFRH